MKGKIDSEGSLMIYRRNSFANQMCPKTFLITIHGGTRPRKCGDWCPLFGEPEKFKFIKRFGEDSFDGIELRLCQKSLMFDKFMDEREGESSNDD